MSSPCADAFPERVPSRDDLIRFGERHPDARLKILCREGHRLSEELQDGNSYRYALLHLGGDSREDVLKRYASALLSLDFGFEPIHTRSHQSPGRIVSANPAS